MKNSFYENRNEKIATAAMPGVDKGNTICTKPRSREQPSTRAASSSSFGTLSN
jgi:hypothetical protein